MPIIKLNYYYINCLINILKTHRVRLLKDKLTAIRQSYGFFIQPDGDSNCLPLVEEKKEWKPMYPKMEKDENHFEYFRERVRGSRAY